MRRVSITYFVAVGCLFLSGAFVSMQRHQITRPRLAAPPAGDTIHLTDVVSAATSGEVADVGLALLMFLGPVARIFRGSMLLASLGVFLLATAVLQYRRLRLGELAGVAWALGVVLLLTRRQHSANYSARFSSNRTKIYAPSYLTVGKATCRGKTRSQGLQLGVRHSRMTRIESLRNPIARQVK